MLYTKDNLSGNAIRFGGTMFSFNIGAGIQSKLSQIVNSENKNFKWVPSCYIELMPKEVRIYMKISNFL